GAAAVGVGVLVGVLVGVAAGVLVGLLELSQATPLSVKLVGRSFAPLKLALKPKPAVPPVGMLPFQLASWAATFAPLWVRAVFQALLTDWLPGKVHASVQPFTVAPL